jgi:hypothetical protein
MGVVQGLILGRHHAQDLLVAQAAEVLDPELDKHHLNLCKRIS